MPLLPVAKRRQSGEWWKEVGRNRKRNHHCESPRIGSLRILNVLRNARELLVSRIKPNPQCKPHPEYFGESLMRWYQRHKWIVTPMCEPKNDHRYYWDKHK